MIPVENISSSTMGNLLYYVAIVGLLLVVATLIRLKVPLLRKAFIPASLLAGLIGLALGPYALGVIPPRYDVFNRDIANSHDYRGICLYASWR